MFEDEAEDELAVAGFDCRMPKRRNPSCNAGRMVKYRRAGHEHLADLDQFSHQFGTIPPSTSISTEVLRSAIAPAKRLTLSFMVGI